MSFKVGQRVRCIKNPPNEDMIGWEGTVTVPLCHDEVDEENYIHVTFDLDPSPILDWPMCEDELELVMEEAHLIAGWREETTMDNSIKMDGKYAYRKDPFTQVRILCVDRPDHPKKPVLSVDSKGWVFTHRLDGRVDFGEDDDDLVPLQVKLPDVWGVLYPDGSFYPLTNKKQAEDWCKGDTTGIKIIHYIPAPDQTS